MWQTIDLTSATNPGIINNGPVRFKLSAWLGGWGGQEDNACISLSFYDEMNGMIADSLILGPVTVSDRNSITSMIYREITGLVPAGAYLVTVRVTLTRISYNDNDASVDNIAFILYQ